MSSLPPEGCEVPEGSVPRFALHSILPIVWLVLFENGQPTGPFHLYAVDGDTHRAPHSPPEERNLLAKWKTPIIAHSPSTE